MYNYDLQVELRYRDKNIVEQIERARWSRLAEADRTSRNRDWGIRRAVLWSGDMVAGLRCLLRSQFAAELSSAAC